MSPMKYWKNLKKYWNITTDPDDNKFVDCAVAGNARFIVTEDHHYDILSKTDFPKVEVIGLDDMICKF